MSIALQQASSAARATTTSFVRDYYDNHIFDSYLHFASTEDEEEYHRREEQHKKDIEKAQAEHTPQGDLKALDASIEQMKDAGAHGAGKSAEFQSRLKFMVEKRNSLSGQLSKQEPTKETPPADPLAAVKPDASVPSDLIAGLRAAGVAIPNQNGTGHGVTAACATPATSQCRS